MAGFATELEGGGAGGFGVSGEAEVVVQAADEQGEPFGDDEEFAVFAQSGGSFEKGPRCFALPNGELRCTVTDFTEWLNELQGAVA